MDFAKELGWNFERKDFNTELPYSYLYEQKRKTDRFSYKMMVRQMKEYALSVGFQGFAAIYKEYCGAMTEYQKERWEECGNPTCFSGQPLELEAGQWSTSDDGVKRSGAFGSEEIACRHPILPVERLVNIDTGEEKLKLAFRKGASWRKIVVDKRILANATKVTELAGIGIAVSSQNARAFVEYISDLENLNYDKIPERKSVGRLGYIPDEGFSPFLEGLIYDGDANYAALFRAVHTHGERQEWVRTAVEARNMSVTAKIMLAASFAAPLLEPVNSLPFFVHLWGVDSGTGKTVALMLAASVWGDPCVGSYVKTFDATDVGLEKTAAFLNSLPLCLDELQLSKDDKGRSKFSVYRLAQGVGRTRGNRGGGVDLTPVWHNCILTTGESPLTGQTSGAGAVNRVIDIECSGSAPVITDGMRISSALKKHYGFAGREFARILYADDSTIERVTERYQELFQSLSGRDTTEKQAMAASAIVLADELMCEWIFGGREVPLTCDEIGKFLASKAAVSLGARAYKFLCDWVTQNSNKLCGRSETVDVLGTLEDGKAYIIRSVFTRVLKDAGFSAESTVSWLKQERLIETRAKNNTRAKRINGIPTECFCLVLPAIEVESEEPDELPL